MDQNVDYNIVHEEPFVSNLLTLPTELIVFIISFLTCTRDIVKLRYVSRRLRNACESPSLWRKLIWPYFDSREYHCMKSVLKACGQYVNHLSFPHRVTPSKLIPMLQHCSNLVELHFSTSKLSCDRLGEVLQSMRKLQILDIQWTGEIPPLLVICNKLKELTIRKQYLYLSDVLTEWAMKGFIPEKLNIFSTNSYMMRQLTQQWLSLNPSSPSTHTSCLKVYGRSKVPMGLSPLLPDIQLLFGHSCTLPYVQASNYGLLGSVFDHLFLTNCTTDNKALGKAKMVLQADVMHFNSDINNLTFVTHFDAAYCHLHSGHLEQLAMACPNLLELNLRGNRESLKRLQGLRTIAACCQDIRGLNISSISIENVESQVQLWEIFSELKLTYLAIDLCALIPGAVDEQIKGVIVGLYQKCLYLKALEFAQLESVCDQCRSIGKYEELLLLSNLTSLIHLFVETCEYPTVVKEIFSRCKQLKYFVLTNTYFTFDSSFAFNCNLEQLYFNSNVNIPDTFMESVSAHGGLVHVVLQVGSVTGDGVAALIGNSPKLMTCDIVACSITASDCKMISKNGQLKLRDFKMTLKKRYSNRQLFSCGGWYSLVTRIRHFNVLVAFENTELASLF